MFVHEIQLRVRYGDTDQMGYVYYGNYAYYYEQARAEAVRAAGISYKQNEDSSTMMPLTPMTNKYIQPAYYDELLTLKTTIPSMPGRIIIFQYEVFNEKKLLIHEGETHLIFMDAVTKKIKTAPPILVEMLKPYFKL